MRATRLSMLSCAAALAGCATDAPTGLDSARPSVTALVSAPATLGLNPAERPLSGGCVTVFAPPPFPLPPTVLQVDTGTCQLAHLGRAAFYSELAIDFVAGTATGTAISFTAANGDILRATSTGTFVPNQIGVVMTATIRFAGGTGRFANATGEGHVEGQVDFAASSTTFRFVDGWISY